MRVRVKRVKGRGGLNRRERGGRVS